MAISNGRKLVNGSDIMMYISDNGTYKSVAHASSHQLTISAESEDIKTKDTGKWGMSEVNTITWQITCDHFYTADGYESYFDNLVEGTPVTVAFGLKKASSDETVNVTADGNWTTDNSVSPLPYWGQAIIESIDWTANAGAKSTFSVTLKGQGAITKIAVQ